MEMLYTPQEVAEKLKLSKYTVYSLIKSGSLDAIRIGKRMYRIKDSDLRRFMDETIRSDRSVEND